jgi:hypothetical protein
MPHVSKLTHLLLLLFCTSFSKKLPKENNHPTGETSPNLVTLTAITVATKYVVEVHTVANPAITEAGS